MNERFRDYLNEENEVLLNKGVFFCTRYSPSRKIIIIYSQPDTPCKLVCGVSLEEWQRYYNNPTISSLFFACRRKKYRWTTFLRY